MKNLDLWRSFILPNWDLYQSAADTASVRKFRKIWFDGIPPSIRRIVWPKVSQNYRFKINPTQRVSQAIGNHLGITRELIDCFLSQARATITVNLNEDKLIFPSHLMSIRLLREDLPKTFPGIGIRRKPMPGSLLTKIRGRFGLFPQ